MRLTGYVLDLLISYCSLSCFSVMRRGSASLEWPRFEAGPLGTERCEMWKFGGGRRPRVGGRNACEGRRIYLERSTMKQFLLGSKQAIRLAIGLRHCLILSVD